MRWALFLALRGPTRGRCCSMPGGWDCRWVMLTSAPGPEGQTAGATWVSEAGGVPGWSVVLYERTASPLRLHPASLFPCHGKVRWFPTAL